MTVNDVTTSATVETLAMLDEAEASLNRIADLIKGRDPQAEATAELVAATRALLALMEHNYKIFSHTPVVARVWRALDALGPFEAPAPRPDVISAAIRAGLLSGDAMRVPDEVCLTCVADAQPCKRAGWHRTEGHFGVRHVHVRLSHEEWDIAQKQMIERWNDEGWI